MLQSNIIKTMIIVCSIFAILWLPENIYYLMVNLEADLTFLESTYYAVLFVSFRFIHYTRIHQDLRNHMFV